METIITQVAENFIKKILESINSGPDLYTIEEKALENCKETAREIVEKYIELLETEIMQDKEFRKENGYSVERKCDHRQIYTGLGEINYERTYYKKASGGYEYIVDSVLGIDSRERVSKKIKECLVHQTKEVSYAKSTQNITGGRISRQTVMLAIRDCKTVEDNSNRALLKTPNLHIDADEAHITVKGGRKSIVPLISVYEGIEKNGKRGECKNIFHISEYGMNAEEIWDKASDEINARYNLEETEIYLHGDGGSWIKQGMDNFRNIHFVLDPYHKNKALTAMLAGITGKKKENFSKELRWALDHNEEILFKQIMQCLCEINPERKKEIEKNGAYLIKHIGAIAIRKSNPEAVNGGCTEPHISHILANRLSTRPMAWSEKTLKHFVPVLAGENFEIKKDTLISKSEKFKSIEKRVQKILKRGTAGLPTPEAIGRLPVNGKVNGIQKILKLYC